MKKPAKSHQEIQKTLERFIKNDIIRTSLDDYAIITFPRGMMDPLTPRIRERVENKYDRILADNKIRKHFYIHFGLCTRKCSGCHYASITNGDKEEAIRAIHDHIDMFPSHKYAIGKTVLFFGGGTPSLMAPHEIKSILDKLTNKFDIKKVVKATLEMHPEIKRDKGGFEDYIKQIKKIGITRVSLGVQESNDNILRESNRGHTIKDALEIYGLLKKYRLKTNLDIMWNLPNQTLEDLEKTLRVAFGLSPDSICAYFYWLRPGTRDYDLYKQNKLKLLNKPIEMKHLIKLIASQHGYRQATTEHFYKGRSLAKRISAKCLRQIDRFRIKKEAFFSNYMKHALIGLGPGSYSYLFSGLEENYMLWSPVPDNAADSAISDGFRKMLDAGLKPYDRVLIFGKEETIRLRIMFDLRAGRLSKKQLDYLLKQGVDSEIETLLNNYIKYRLLYWNKKGQLVYTDAGDMMPNYIAASFSTDDWLSKIIARRDEKEDRYSWFPDARMVLKLKNMVKKGL